MRNKKSLTPMLKGLICMLVFLLSVECGKKKEQKPIEEKKEEATIETGLRKINDTEFAEFIVNEKPVLVIFEKEDCPACPSAKAIVEEIAAENGDKYLVATVDASANPAAVANNKIEATPTIIIFKNGAEVGRFAGDSIDKAAIIEKLNN